jgi:hypothetical protein
MENVADEIVEKPVDDKVKRYAINCKLNIMLI